MNLHWRLGNKVIDASRPRVMAILNATPDSFHAASRLSPDPDALAQSLAEVLAAGPDLVDVGGQSSRPGSARVSATEEAARVTPVLAALRALAPDLHLTVDTYQASVARAALAAGADGVNDISALRFDPELAGVLRESECGYVLMHMLGTPESMQQSPRYDDCVGEVYVFLERKLHELDRLGISRDRVTIDPGIGFGKRLEDNLALIRDAGRFHALGRPILYGVSRKRFIGAITGAEDTADRLPGTLGVTWALLDQGVMLHRVHDPAPVKQLCDVWQALHQPVRDP